MASPSAEAIRSTTKAVLARPEFQPETDPFDILRKLLDSLDGVGAGLPAWVGWLFLAGATTLIVYLLTRLLPGPSARSARRNRAAVLVDVLEGAATTPEEALRHARQAFENGNLRQALWIAHRLLLYQLDEQEALRFAGHKTNADYRRECSDPLLAEVSEDYDRVIYAQRDIEPERVESYLHRVGERL